MRKNKVELVVLRPLIYIPDHAVPDQGIAFAPGICALKQAESLLKIGHQPIVACAREGLSVEDCYRGVPIYRFEVGKLYRRVFQKITRLDPYPLAKRIGQRAKGWNVSCFHVHQPEFMIRHFRAQAASIPVFAHMHNTDRAFDPQLGVADCYVVDVDVCCCCLLLFIVMLLMLMFADRKSVV